LFLIAELPPNGGKCPKGDRGAVSKKAKHPLRFSDKINTHRCWIILYWSIPIAKGAVAK
jgi:hypothetical protein